MSSKELMLGIYGVSTTGTFGGLGGKPSYDCMIIARVYNDYYIADPCVDKLWTMVKLSPSVAEKICDLYYKSFMNIGELSFGVIMDLQINGSVFGLYFNDKTKHEEIGENVYNFSCPNKNVGIYEATHLLRKQIESHISRQKSLSKANASVIQQEIESFVANNCNREVYDFLVRIVPTEKIPNKKHSIYRFPFLRFLKKQ